MGFRPSEVQFAHVAAGEASLSAGQLHDRRSLHLPVRANLTGAYFFEKYAPVDAPTRLSYHNTVSRVNKKLYVPFHFYSLHEFENIAL